MQKETATLPILTNESLQNMIGLLPEHIARAERAEVFFNDKILPLIQKNVDTITPEDDQALNDFMVAINNTVKDMTGKRAPFFKVVDEYRSSLIMPEKEVANLGEQAKKKRDAYVTYLKNIEAEKNRIAAEQLRIKNLMIDYRQQIVYQLNDWGQTKLKEFKDKVLKSFNESTLSNIDTFEKRLMAIIEETSFAIEWPIAPPFMPAFDTIPQIDRENIFSEERLNIDTHSLYAARNNYAREFLSKVPNKRKELEAEEAANAEQRQKIEEERAAFQKAEQERINREVEESNAAAQARSKMEAETQKGQSLFDAIPKTNEDIAPKGTREDAELHITSIDGYAKIIALWLRHEAPALPLEDLPKKAISVMVTFAKKRYLLTGEKIDSPSIEYIDKASTRAVKK